MNNASPKVLMRVESLKKVYRTGKQDLVIFEDLSFNVCAGEMLAIVGESGSGKSTLLHLLGALDRPSAGQVWFGDSDLNAFSDDAAAIFRNRELGYVWQFHYLLPEFSALENVAMPLLLTGTPQTTARDQAAQWLKYVGLLDRAEHRPGELSGGEQQRVALARALVTKPKILMADEPTGDLDGKTAEAVLELILRLHRDHGLTSLLVTHNLEFAARCDRVLRIRKGKLEQVDPAALRSS
ncbi:MAG TPA: ABC transporter ATP-binding protein [Terriglobales bacterium]|nr:ABC transporter ATP-binding protein [Terriglobales bacterium]